MYDLKGKNAIVTGGATGIGFCYVRDLLKMGVSKCAILDVNMATGQETTKKFMAEFGKDRVIFFKCDVTNKMEFEAAFKTVMTTFKTLDILVNNAGILNDSEWEKQILINVNGVVHGTYLGMRFMGKDMGGNGGTIVNVASILGCSPMAGCPVYVGTKHAVQGMTRSWAMPYYYSKTGIRMLTMCPGVTDTDLISGAGKRQSDPNMSMECHKELSALPKQSPDHVSQGLMHMLINGENGSIWICEGGEPIYEIKFPTRMEMKKV